jgi:hypothetical protein
MAISTLQCSTELVFDRITCFRPEAHNEEFAWTALKQRLEQGSGAFWDNIDYQDAVTAGHTALLLQSPAGEAINTDLFSTGRAKLAASEALNVKTALQRLYRHRSAPALSDFARNVLAWEQNKDGAELASAAWQGWTEEAKTETGEQSLLAYSYSNHPLLDDSALSAFFGGLSLQSLSERPGKMSALLETREKLQGVSSSQVLFGSAFSFFALHHEQCCLGAINVLLCGAPKIWFVVEESYNEKVTKLFREVIGRVNWSG